MTHEFWRELEGQVEKERLERKGTLKCESCCFLGLRLIYGLRACTISIHPDETGYCEYWIEDWIGNRIWRYYLEGYGE